MYAHKKDGLWWHIYPIAAAVKMCGAEDIRRIKLTVDPEGDYWGWWDAEKDKFAMIYPNRILLTICFPYGVQAAEEAGQGKAMRFNIEEVEDA
jgi:hypothetical protein